MNRRTTDTRAWRGRALLFRGGDHLDLESGQIERRDLLVRDGRVHIVWGGDVPDDALVFDITGKTVLPGLVDIHVHLREPGGEEHETIASGAAAAARGGFTKIVSMANTDPVIDDPQSVRYVVERARTAEKTRVYPIAAVSMGLEGKRLTEMFDLAEAGAVGFSDDGRTIMNAELMRRALEYAGMLGKVIVTHAEDTDLKGSGVAHEGFMATKLGLRPVPRAVEEVIVARDIQLVELTGGKIHVAHVSCASTVDMIRDAQRRGLKVTGEVTPHHLVFTDENLAGYDTNFKMAPPLREKEDREALLEGLRDGTLAAVATDHAPHNEIVKDVEFDAAPNGVVGCETAFAALYTTLVKPGAIDLRTLVRRMSTGPASVLGIEHGEAADGGPADLTVVDLERAWTVRAEDFVGKSANSPWIGEELFGAPVLTVVEGAVVHAEDLAPASARDATGKRQTVSS